MKFQGKVVKGRQEARKLGYPTANILCTDLTPDLAGGWGGVIKINSYTSKYFVGIVTTSYILEAHLYHFNEDIYDEVVEVELFTRIESSGLSLDVEKYRNKRCDKCRFCTLKDYGYSAYTVLGTDSVCELNQRSDFEYESYNANSQELYAVSCPKYKKGDPSVEKLEE